MAKIRSKQNLVFFANVLFNNILYKFKNIAYCIELQSLQK